ncbi:MAG TPA: hypothetical protein VN736_18670 [Candidatus Limnocylindrales bacterium]|nr:hypothetical protein [Candidatus Limnocylindrales bacterium]
MERRTFLQTAASGAFAAAAPAAPADRKMVGIQVGAVSFVDEGVEQVLDTVQRDGAVNTLFVATFTYGRGIAGRQVPGQPLPDHGKREYDTTTFHGGSYTRVHPQYYRDTAITDFRAPEFGDYDVLEAVLPSARKRGMKTICWFEDVWRRDVPRANEAQEMQFDGNHAVTFCFNNPNYRNWLLGTVEDYTRSYDIDGIMWGSEREGAFSNMLRGTTPGAVTCFCGHCEAKARQRGINVERAREGFTALSAFVTAARANRRPVDGYYVTLWRTMLRYPELLAWEMLWTDSLRETYAAMYERVKSIKPSVGVGWHIWHNNSFSPIYRAEQDLSVLQPHSDFLKMVMYHNCGGERMAGYIRNMGRTMFADVPQQELLDFHYRVLGYTQEKPLDQLAKSGFSANYVYEEAKRAREALTNGKTQLWPGIDIDIPTDVNRSSRSTPEGTSAAVKAAFRAGADGVLLSRKYSEMRLENLRGAGRAVRELGFA